MKIVIDAMGGDRAPEINVYGAVMAVNELGVDLILTGDKTRIDALLKEQNYDKSKIEVINTTEIIDMHDEPVKAIKRKKDSSLVVGLNLVASGEAQAIVSAGNTGAVLAGGALIVKRIRGVLRPCLCPGLPNKSGGLTIIADAGANADCKENYLVQFAHMGSIYMSSVLDIKNPRVALANIGAEPTKGSTFYKNVYKLLEEEEDLNFIGNMESRDIIEDVCDVIVADGFTGNMLLKCAEGMASSIMSLIKESITSTTKSKIGGLLIKDSLKSMKKKFDYTEYGGAPLLGVNGGVIKAHGSSDEVAIKNAIRQAKRYIENDVTGKITSAIGG